MTHSQTYHLQLVVETHTWPVDHIGRLALRCCIALTTRTADWRAADDDGRSAAMVSHWKMGPIMKSVTYMFIT